MEISWIEKEKKKRIVEDWISPCGYPMQFFNEIWGK
jgi:hypothetical protein